MPANDLKCGITLEDGRCAVLTVVCTSFGSWGRIQRNSGLLRPPVDRAARLDSITNLTCINILAARGRYGAQWK